MGRGDHQAKVLKPCEAFNDCRARQVGSLHEQAQADRHTPVGHTATGFDDRQIDLDGFAANPGQVATVKENGLDPVVRLGSGIATDMIGQLLLEEVSRPGDRLPGPTILIMDPEQCNSAGSTSTSPSRTALAAYHHSGTLTTSRYRLSVISHRLLQPKIAQPCEVPLDPLCAPTTMYRFGTKISDGELTLEIFELVLSLLR